MGETSGVSMRINIQRCNGMNGKLFGVLVIGTSKVKEVAIGFFFFEILIIRKK